MKMGIRNTYKPKNARQEQDDDERDDERYDKGKSEDQNEDGYDDNPHMDKRTEEFRKRGKAARYDNEEEDGDRGRDTDKRDTPERDTMKYDYRSNPPKLKKGEGDEDDIDQGDKQQINIKMSNRLFRETFLKCLEENPMTISIKGAELASLIRDFLGESK
jgi:hypothetical protein